MTASVRDLYQEVILDHGRKPRNYQKLADANRTAVGDNPLCGDHVELFLKVQGDEILDIGFQGQGCAISKASASLLTQAVKGKRAPEVEALFEGFHQMVTRKKAEPFDEERVGKLAVLSGVAEFPARVKCASLAWHTLKAALKAEGGVVSTEK